ncbi:MAG: cysteine desulfurase family protein [Candidatus Saccharimonadales bacterium]
MMKSYFDYAAATPVSEPVLAAMQPYFSDQFYNPSALYLAAAAVKQAVTIARQDVARELGCKPSEIVFTAGGTESANLSIHGVMQHFPGGNCVVSATEHEAVLAPAKQYSCRIAPVRPDGRIDLQAVEDLIDDNTVLVSVMYANNEIGTVQPLREIAKIIARKRAGRRRAPHTDPSKPLYFHTDACQAGNYLPLLTGTLGVDMMTLNGGKMYGPKQSGVLYVRTGVRLSPQILGGGQERNLRSGTENVPGIIGFAAALKQSAGMREAESKRLRVLQDRIITTLKQEAPRIVINGTTGYRLPNNVHITVPAADNERLMMELDERGIMVAAGSACSASSDQPSHVLTAIGLSDDEARASLRITLGRGTDDTDVDKLLRNLLELVAR